MPDVRRRNLKPVDIFPWIHTEDKALPSSAADAHFTRNYSKLDMSVFLAEIKLIAANDDKVITRARD